MIRVSAIYEAQDGATFNWDYYLNRHLPMVREKMCPLGMTKIEADKGLFALPPGTPSPYVAIAHLYFPSLEVFQTALAQEAPGILADIPNYTNIPAIIVVSEIVST
jgi:uncharacterized protein (TIGR02118 family)